MWSGNNMDFGNWKLVGIVEAVIFVTCSQPKLYIYIYNKIKLGLFWKKSIQHVLLTELKMLVLTCSLRMTHEVFKIFFLK